MYDYYAVDINGFEIAREGLDRETMERHVRNLVVMGYRVAVRDHGSEDEFREFHHFFR